MNDGWIHFSSPFYMKFDQKQQKLTKVKTNESENHLTGRCMRNFFSLHFSLVLLLMIMLHRGWLGFVCIINFF